MKKMIVNEVYKKLISYNKRPKILNNIFKIKYKIPPRYKSKETNWRYGEYFIVAKDIDEAQDTFTEMPPYTSGVVVVSVEFICQSIELLKG